MPQHNESTLAVCERLEADLVLHYYGELEGAAESRIETHLRSCEPCRRYLQEMRSILPLTVQSDEPPQSFWIDYNRELRHKLSEAKQNKFGWRHIPSLFQSWTLPALAAAAVVILALTFTLGRGPWLAPDAPMSEEIFLEVLPLAENLEFYRTMEVLDAMDLLEFMGSQAKSAA